MQTKAQELEALLAFCVARPPLHARLLNTFAYLEHMGARKIHRFQRFGLGDPFVLKHAAEEARHAWHFKRQMGLIGDPNLGFARSEVLGGRATRGYLRQLDIAANRYLGGELGLPRRAQFLAAYLLVTYVIEVRAGQLYPTYARVLRQAGSPVQVRSVIKEEEQHLAEMRSLLQEALGADFEAATETLCAYEATLYGPWLAALAAELGVSSPILACSAAVEPLLENH